MLTYIFFFVLGFMVARIMCDMVVVEGDTEAVVDLEAPPRADGNNGANENSIKHRSRFRDNNYLELFKCTKEKNNKIKELKNEFNLCVNKINLNKQ